MKAAAASIISASAVTCDGTVGDSDFASGPEPAAGPATLVQQKLPMPRIAAVLTLLTTLAGCTPRLDAPVTVGEESFTLVDADGSKLRRAFVYDWRLWTLPELQELMLEAGFKSTEVYTEGWDVGADDTDGIFRRRRYFENQEGWVAYVVGLT